MGSSLRRRTALVALALLVTVPAGSTACEVLCAPALHAAIHGDALPAAGGACHEAGESAAPALSAAPAHGCGEHARSTLDVAVWLKTGRFTVDLRPLSWLPLSATPAPAIEPLVARGRWTAPSPPVPSSTHTSLASVVLRI